MTPIKLVVAHNLATLRKQSGLTQSELAQRFNYTDKAVSKWEHAQTMPDLETLDRLAEFYGIALADLLTEGGVQEITPKSRHDRMMSSWTKWTIAILSVTVVWLIAVLLFYVFDLVAIEDRGPFQSWIIFLWAIPVSCIILLVFNAIWGKSLWRTILIITLVWTLLLCVYLQLGHVVPDGRGYNFWAIFFIGIPTTVAAVLWGFLSLRAERSRVNRR